MIPIDMMDSVAARKAVQIQISWLHQKPADLDLHCFLKRMHVVLAGQGLICASSFRHYDITNQCKCMYLHNF